MKKLTVLATVMAMGVAAAFADTKGVEIMTKVHDVKKPDFSVAKAEMNLIAKNGSVDENRVFWEYGANMKKADGNKDITKMVMNFIAPAGYAGTRFLQIENGPEDGKFVRLKTDANPRRVNSSEDSKSFLGTDASYGDLKTREVEDDNHTYLRDENHHGFDCHVIESVAKDPSSSQYSKKVVWIDKVTMYPVYTELYDKNGKLEKQLTVKTIKNVDGYDIPMDNEYKNVQTGHSTQLKISAVVVDKQALALMQKMSINPKTVFTQNFLKNGK
ncbi:MAG: outer membrane lipoprotein-sorting protein [Treponema sp.]|nr:outer membrane lipoprotein-sorting protein [Candidatus Treponema equi]